MKNSSFSSGSANLRIDFERELGFDALQLALLDMQHGRTLRGRLVEFVDVDRGFVARPFADEGLALLLRHRDQTDVRILDAHIAVVERYVQRLVRRYLLGVDQTAEAAQEIRTVVVAHLLVDLDLVVGQFILVRQREVDLRSFADLEHELELGAVLEVETALFVRRDHVAEVVDLLLPEVFENGVRGQTIGLLGQHALAVHLLHEPHRHHARPESRNVGFAFVVAERLLDGFAVVLFAHGYFDERCVLFALFSNDIHTEWVLYFVVSLPESACKDTTYFMKNET